MNFLDRLKLLMSGNKASAARTLSSQMLVGQAIQSPSNYNSYAREGYAKNVIAHRCIALIAGACKGIELQVYTEQKQGERVYVSESPLISLLDKPNPMQSGEGFVEYAIAYYLLSGNSYIEAVRPSPKQVPVELWPVRPDKMKIEIGKNGYPSAFVYDVNGMQKKWPIDVVKMTSDIMHMKTFNPLHDWFGMSPLEAAMLSLDQSNAASKWNLSLLQNSASPSGVLQMVVNNANPKGSLTTEQFERLKAEFYNSHIGSKNSGRPMLLEGGLEWKQIALSPKDMDFLKSKEVNAMDIALVYGVPPELLGLGQKTFNNYKEARCAFYEDTVLPILDQFCGELTRWLAPVFGEELKIGYNPDDIEALAIKREAKFVMVKDANFMTQNEKREAVGLAKQEGWDVFLINNQLLESPDEMMTGMEDPNAEPEVDENGDPIEPDPAEENPQDPKKPTPKKPAPGKEEAPEAEDADEKSTEFKTFNLLNRNEKKKSWKRQNRKRAELISPFEKDVKFDLDDLAYRLGKSIDGITEPKLIEFALMKTLGEEMEDLRKTLKRHIKYSVEAFGNSVFDEAKSIGLYMETKAKRSQYDSFVDAYVEKRTASAISEIEGTTKKKIHSVIRRLVSESINEGTSEADLSKELQEHFEGLSAGRAQNIARTEVTMASTNGQLEAVKTLQIPGMTKEWVSAEDDRVRDGGKGDDANHEIMDGVVMDLDEKFTVPPDASMDCPGDSAGGASQVCNCRCALVYKVRRND